jgi:GntR family transcriptional regulator/MocR family aminotransferase
VAHATQGRWQLRPSNQGMHLLHEMPADYPDQALSQRAQEAGLMLAPLSRYTMESKRRGWLLGYAGYDSTALRLAAEQLGELLQKT